MRTIEIINLKPHPLNAEIYQEDVVPPDFLESIRRMGILNPLVILEDGTIISGHRRYRAAKELNLKYIPIYICKLENPLDIGEAIIESNRQREKTFSQKMREAEMLEKIEATRARERQLSGLKQGDIVPVVENFPQRDMGKSRDKVAEKVGIGSGRQYDKAKKIWRAAKEGDPVAQDQISKLDADEITIHAASKILNKKNDTMAVHYSSGTSEWHTPSTIIERTLRVLGEINLDPCSNSHESPNVPALEHYTQEDDGLCQAWHGRVYMNPPYGREIVAWVHHLCEQFEKNNIVEAIALVPARTDTEWFRQLRQYPRCFIWGRLRFSENETGAPFPSMAVYLGNNLDAFIDAFQDIGDIYQLVS